MTYIVSGGALNSTHSLTRLVVICARTTLFVFLLHSATSKVMVIVWRFRWNIIRTVLYIANVLPFQYAQLTKTVHIARLGLEFVFLCFLGWMIYLYVLFVLFYLGQLSHFPSCFGAGVTNLNKPPSSFCCPPLLQYCRLGAGSIPFFKQKHVRDEGVVYRYSHPLLNSRCIRLAGCVRLRNDPYCVGWMGVQVYSSSPWPCCCYRLHVTFYTLVIFHDI